MPLIKRDGGFVREGYETALDETRSLRDASRLVVAAMQARYADDTGIKALKIRHNNVLGYFVEVTAQHGDKLMSPPLNATFIHRQTLAGQVRFTTAELGEIEAKIANAGDRALGLELEIFDKLCAMALAAGDDLRAAAHAFAMLDVATALAKLADRRQLCAARRRSIPRFRGRGRPASGGRTGAEARRPAVHRQLLRSLAWARADLGPALADHRPQHGRQIDLPAPERVDRAACADRLASCRRARARIGIVDRLFSRVGAADDLARGRSTFMVEMVETAVILNQASERSLVILDEIGRGTATFDGLSIAWAAIEHLHEANRCRTLFATHYHELTALSAKLPRMFNATVRVKEWQGDVVFLHEVLPGSADRSYGIQVAKLAGLPPPVIARAKAVLAKLEAQDRGQTARALIDDLPLFAVPSRAGRRGHAAERSRAIDRRRQGAASGRDDPARGAGCALCAEGEAAEGVAACFVAFAPRNDGLMPRRLPFAPEEQAEIPADTRRKREAQSDRRAELAAPRHCSTAMASPKPIRPQALLAITAAVGGPPMRGCRISIRLVNTIGNSAMMPEIFGPTQPEVVTTVATSVATSAARSGNVVPAPRDQRHLDVAIALQQRHADRKGNDVDDQAGRAASIRNGG